VNAVKKGGKTRYLLTISIREGDHVVIYSVGTRKVISITIRKIKCYTWSQQYRKWKKKIKYFTTQGQRHYIILL